MSAAVKTFDGLTGLRGAAALWVAAYHASAQLFPDAMAWPPLHRILSSGWLAVDLFFVLSGFIMCHVHLADFQAGFVAPAREFLKLRISRIYPAHLVAMLCWLPLLAVLALRSGGTLPEPITANYNPQTFTHAVLLTNGWGFPGSLGWNLPSWSVGSEWFAYLCFPLLALSLRRVRSAWTYAGIGAVTIAVCLGLAIFINGGSRYMLPESFTLIRVLSEFLLGCCAYGVFVRLGAIPVWLAGAAAAFCAVLAAAPRDPIFDVLFMPLFAALVVGLASEKSFGAPLLGSALMKYLGRISYSLYLMHALVIVVFRQVLALIGELGLGGKFVVSAAFLIAVIIAGDLLHRVVEEPMRGYLRRVWIKRSPALAVVSPKVAQ